MQQGPLAPAPRGRWARWAATLAYAICLLEGALIGLVVEVFVQGWSGAGEAGFLLVCAAAFAWGVRRIPGPCASSGQGRNSRVNPTWWLRRVGLVLTGVGTVTTVVMAQVLEVYDLYDRSIATYPQVLLLIGFMLATLGVSLVLIDAALRLTAPSRGTTGSLHQWGLVLTGVGTGTAVAMFLLSRFALYVQHTGPPYLPLTLLGLGYMVAAGGVITLLIDGVRRRTRRL